MAIPQGQKLTKELIDKLYPEMGKPNPQGNKNLVHINTEGLKVRQTLLGLLSKQDQNVPERVGDGGDALNELYRMIPIRLRPTSWEGMGVARGYYDENEALRTQTKESIFNLEQTAKAEKLKARKRDKQAFGGGASTPERRVPVSATQGDVGTLLGSSNTSNKTLLGG